MGFSPSLVEIKEFLPHQQQTHTRLGREMGDLVPEETELQVPQLCEMAKKTEDESETMRQDAPLRMKIYAKSRWEMNHSCTWEMLTHICTHAHTR